LSLFLTRRLHRLILILISAFLSVKCLIICLYYPYFVVSILLFNLQTAFIYMAHCHRCSYRPRYESPAWLCSCTSPFSTYNQKKSLNTYLLMFTLESGYALIYFAWQIPYLHLFLLLLHKLLLLLLDRMLLHLHHSIWWMLLCVVNVVGVSISCTLNSGYYQIRLRRGGVWVWNIGEGVVCQV
jgi:hypothetical protein